MPGKSCISGTPGTPSRSGPPAPWHSQQPCHYPTIPVSSESSTPDAHGNSGMPSAPLGALMCLAPQYPQNTWYPWDPQYSWYPGCPGSLCHLLCDSLGHSAGQHEAAHSRGQDVQERVEDTRARGHAEPVTTAAELGRGMVSGDPRGPALLPSPAQHTLPTQPRSQSAPSPAGPQVPPGKAAGAGGAPVLLCPPWPSSALLSPRGVDGIRGLSARPALPSARCSLQATTPGVLNGHCPVTPGLGHPCPEPGHPWAGQGPGRWPGHELA